MAEMIVEPIEKYGLSQKDRPKVLFSKIGIVGCGSVGQELVITASKHGIEVVFLELSDALIEHSFSEIKRQLDDEINHWGLTPSEKNAILSRIKGTLVYEDFADCELVIESIKASGKESTLDLRKQVFTSAEFRSVPGISGQSSQTRGSPRRYGSLRGATGDRISVFREAPPPRCNRQPTWRAW